MSLKLGIGTPTFGSTPRLRVGSLKKQKKKFVRIKTLFRTHISNKKKYLFQNFGGRGGATGFVFEPFPKLINFCHCVGNLGTDINN